MINEKYIQAFILGSLIGGAILFDDYVIPTKEKTMKKHMIIKSDFKEKNKNQNIYNRIKKKCFISTSMKILDKLLKTVFFQFDILS